MSPDEVLAQLEAATPDFTLSADAMRCNATETPTPAVDGPEEYPVQIVDDTINDFLHRLGVR